MLSRTIKLTSIMGFAVLAAMVAGHTAAAPWVQVPAPAQGFNPDVRTCIGATAPNPAVALAACSGTENLLLATGPAGPAIEMAIRIPGGTRVENIATYVGPGWQFPGIGGLPTPADGSTLGGIKRHLDLFCDGAPDVLADSTSTGNPATTPLTSGAFAAEASVTRTTSWGVATGPVDQPDETLLDKMLPPTGYFDHLYRLRTDFDTIFLPGPVTNPVIPVAPVHQVGMSPSWSPHALMTTILPVGVLPRLSVLSPSTLKYCVDPPAGAIISVPTTVFDGIASNPLSSGADVGGNGRDDNSGYYARWTVFLSGRDPVNGEMQASIVLECKYVSADYPAGTSQMSPPAGGDDDGDCLQDGANEEPGRSGFVDDNDTNADQDGDGLVDGVEVAWGSCPDTSFVFTFVSHGFSFACTGVGDSKDTDADGRSDLEEMLGDGRQLSNPRFPDTDSDGVNDGGLAWDADDDGIPDSILSSGWAQALAGGATSAAKVNRSFQIPGTAITPYEGDNCSMIANGAQTNSDSAAGNAEDRTNADEDAYGDACDTDNDNDNFVDAAEPLNNWITGFPPEACRTTGGGGYAAAATSGSARDSDGDRFLDGSECREGKNPASSTSRPPFASCTTASGTPDPPYIESCGSDADGIGLATERLERTTAIIQAEGAIACGSGQLCDIDLGRVATDGSVAGTTGNGDADADSDADGLTDGREANVWGTSPANQDTDADGCPDGVEVVSVGGGSDAGQRQIEYTDFFELLDHYGTTSASGGWATGGVFVDWDPDASIGFGDFVIMLSLWNKKCEPTAVLEPGSSSPPPGTAVNIHIAPNPKTAAALSVGNTFVLEATGIAPNVSAYSIVATYDPTVIDVTGVGDSSGIASNICPGLLPDTGGGAASGAFEATCGSTASGSVSGPTVSLATVTFNCLAEESTAITFTTSVLRDATGARTTAGTTSGTVTCGTPGSPAGPAPTQVSVGGEHSCLVRTDGSIDCWGRGDFGQLGYSATPSLYETTRVAVSGLGGTATQVSAGFYFTCALMNTGSVRCWGFNAFGQAGDGTQTQRNLPVTVSGITNAVQIATGVQHACALLATGEVRCWGDNGDGQLGDGTNTMRLTPVTMTSTDTSPVDQITAGDGHTCVHWVSGGLSCTGLNTFGQLGDGTTTARNALVPVGGVSDLHAVDGGGSHTCALRISEGEKVYCWGRNLFGALGDGTNTDHLTPSPATGSTGIAEVEAGGNHTCSLNATSKAVQCWGYNTYGQLGLGDTIDRVTPTTVGLSLMPGTTSVDTSAGYGTTCVLERPAGRTQCWGRNAPGEVGDHTLTNRMAPALVANLGTNDADDDDDTCSDAIEIANQSIPKEPNDPHDSSDFANIDNAGGVVGFGDFVALLASYNKTPAMPGWNPRADLDFSDSVGFGDFVRLLASYNRTC